MRRWLWLVLVVAVAVAPGCGHDSDRDVARDAAGSLNRVHRGTVHLALELAAQPGDPATRMGFQVDGRFDLAPSGASLPAVDLTTTNLGAPNQPATHIVSTGHDAFLVRDGIGYRFTPQQVAPLQTDVAASGQDLASADLGRWIVDPAPQPSAKTPAGDTVDRVTGRADPVAALNGIVDLAGRLGTEPDPALRISDADAQHVRNAVQSSRCEVLAGRDDHVLRSLDVQVEMATTASSTGGAVVHALNKLGHVSLTIELRIDDANEPVTIAPPAQIAG